MKSCKTPLGTEVLAYQPQDIFNNNHDFNAIVQAAKREWQSRCSEFVQTRGDTGSCVIGAGIVVWYLPKRARNVARFMIIEAHEVSCGAQGSIVWEDSVNDILKYLREHGIDADYACGRMD